MSFFSSPAQYLREALEARRERQREEKAARKEADRKKPFFGNRRNLHDHRPNQEPIFKENEEEYHEDDNDEPTPSPSRDNFKWRSISNFSPNFLFEKELEIEESKNKSQDAESRGPLAIMAKGEVATSACGSGSSFEEVKSINEEEDDKTLPGMKSHIIGELGLANDGDSEKIALRRTLDRRDIPQEIEIPFGLPESIPSGPIYYSEQSECWGPFRCGRYKVSLKLAGSYTRQSRFMKRVMLVLGAQYVFLLAWVATVLYVPAIGNPIADNFNYSYIPLGIFILSKILLRSMVKIRKFAPLGLILISFFRLICLSYYCGAVSVFAQTDLILLTGFLLLLSHIFFTVSANFVDYDVKSSEIVGMAAVINILFSFIILIPFVIWKIESATMFNIIVTNWLPSFGCSQMILMLLISDIKQIMGGWRFPLAEADWIFTVLYL